MSLITENTASGNGSNPNFPFTFEYVKESDVYVSVDDVVKTLNTHYTFAPNTSSVTFLPAHIPANGAAVRIFRDTSISTPSAEFFPGSAIRAQDLNANNDQVLFSAQERKERSLDATGGSLTGQLDMQTNKIINLGTPTANADASTKAYVDSTVGTVSSYATSASASAAAALASETAAGTSETNAATSETNAATSATNSATSATNSATSATASATSATAAATSETNAATSETNAATSATAASTSATSAATSAASALAAFDNFDDTYLGAKASDPTTDNDGDPLNGGDLYYNTTDDVMRVYTGSAWVTAYVPGDAANITSTATGDVAATNVQDAIAELDTEKVPRTSTTGSAKLPVGTTAQRDGSPASGMIRYNTTTSSFEGYGSAWGAIGGGATGGGTDSWALEHDNTVTTSYTISTGKNVVSAGPLTINSGATVTVPSGSTWVIV
jgi:hypothetical protein